ncbi:hypothetical protein HXX01_04710 [Candidatus Nomurabacteria bacterium]|nr:hypothetical protein [Candidatus Nomurabacteria bacterium]
MKRNKNVYFSLGQTGANLILKKLSLRKGKTSTVEPGHEMEITLSSPIKLGNKISQTIKEEVPENEGLNHDPIKKKEFVTSKVEGMASLNDGISFKIKTETSNYLVTFILNN